MNMAEQPFLALEPGWQRIRDGSWTAREIYNRHYSARRYADGRDPAKVVGPGQYMVLMTSDARALFVWRRFIDDADDGSGNPQRGVNCAVFRNEAQGGGAPQSSILIREADDLAWSEPRWRGERHYTYVDPRRIRSTNPGYCFLQAGWRRCGFTRGGLVILERLP